MRFGAVAPDEAEGAILAHSLRVGGRMLKKGLVLGRAEIAALTAALSVLPGEIALILTGSATSDVQDTGPASVRAAAGTVTRFGMPVDPGNLLFLGEQGGRPVIGLPGCARRPA